MEKQKKNWMLYLGIVWFVIALACENTFLTTLGIIVGPVLVLIWAIKSRKKSSSGVRMRNGIKAVCASCGEEGILLKLTEDGLCKECEKRQHDKAVADYNKLVESYSGIELFRKHMDDGNIEEVKRCIELCESFDLCAQATEITISFEQVFLSHVGVSYRGTELLDFGNYLVFDKDIKGASQLLLELLDTTRTRKDMMVDFVAQAEHFNAVLGSLTNAEIIVEDKPATKHAVNEVYDIGFSNVTKKTPRDKLGNFVAIDTETTGLSASKDEIVEIAAVRFRGFAPVEKFVTLCSTKKGISDEAARINGITADMVDGKPLFGQIVNSLQSFIGTDNIVGHNLEFDLKFIIKGGFDVYACNRKYYDTLDIAKKTLKKVKEKWDKEVHDYMPDYDRDYDVENYKLKTLCQYYGITYMGAHRALADAYVTGLLLEKLAKDRE